MVDSFLLNSKLLFGRFCQLKLKSVQSVKIKYQLIFVGTAQKTVLFVNMTPKWNTVILKGNCFARIRYFVNIRPHAICLDGQTLLGANSLTEKYWPYVFAVAEGLHLSLFSHIRERPISAPAACCVTLTTCSSSDCDWPDLYSCSIFCMTFKGSQQWQSKSCPPPSSQSGWVLWRQWVSVDNPKRSICFDSRGGFFILYGSVLLLSSPLFTLLQHKVKRECTLWHAHADNLYLSFLLQHTHTFQHTLPNQPPLCCGCAWN